MEITGRPGGQDPMGAGTLFDYLSAARRTAVANTVARVAARAAATVVFPLSDSGAVTRTAGIAW